VQLTLTSAPACDLPSWTVFGCMPVATPTSKIFDWKPIEHLPAPPGWRLATTNASGGGGLLEHAEASAAEHSADHAA
jgi:hypothetical protein